jgi:hypothetical protein
VRPLASTCATGVGLGATVSVDLCHRSGLEYLSHGFQTQGTIAAGAGLKVRPKSTLSCRTERTLEVASLG